MAQKLEIQDATVNEPKKEEQKEVCKKDDDGAAWYVNERTV